MEPDQIMFSLAVTGGEIDLEEGKVMLVVSEGGIIAVPSPSTQKPRKRDNLNSL